MHRFLNLWKVLKWIGHLVSIFLVATPTCYMLDTVGFYRRKHALMQMDARRAHTSVCGARAGYRRHEKN